jgi:transposase InsO family protein
VKSLHKCARIKVERAQRNHKEEFHEVHPDDLSLDPMEHALQAWEKVYNFVRPHHSLDGLTPEEYIQKYHPRVAPNLSHMS